MSESNEWETLKNHEDYEINVNYPYQIRKKSTCQIINESLRKNDGYLRCKLNKKDYLKHVLIGKQWIENDDPEHKSEIDHINRIRSDNRIENLRWVSRNENDKNRIKSSANIEIIYEYVDKIDDAIEITDYENINLNSIIMLKKMIHFIILMENNIENYI